MVCRWEWSISRQTGVCACTLDSSACAPQNDSEGVRLRTTEGARLRMTMFYCHSEPPHRHSEPPHRHSEPPHRHSEPPHCHSERSEESKISLLGLILSPDDPACACTLDSSACAPQNDSEGVRLRMTEGGAPQNDRRGAPQNDNVLLSFRTTPLSFRTTPPSSRTTPLSFRTE